MITFIIIKNFQLSRSKCKVIWSYFSYAMSFNIVFTTWLSPDWFAGSKLKLFLCYHPHHCYYRSTGCLHYRQKPMIIKDSQWWRSLLFFAKMKGVWAFASDACFFCCHYYECVGEIFQFFQQHWLLTKMHVSKARKWQRIFKNNKMKKWMSNFAFKDKIVGNRSELFFLQKVKWMLCTFNFIFLLVL